MIIYIALGAASRSSASPGSFRSFQHSVPNRGSALFFGHHPGENIGWQNAVAVFLALVFKQLLGRHADYASGKRLE
jgi:hypothetical protein